MKIIYHLSEVYSGPVKTPLILSFQRMSRSRSPKPHMDEQALIFMDLGFLGGLSLGHIRNSGPREINADFK